MYSRCTNFLNAFSLSSIVELHCTEHQVAHVSHLCLPLDIQLGVLVVATNQSRHVNFYSTVKPVTELVSRTPFHTITVADPVKSLTWKVGSVPPAINLIPGVDGSGESKSSNMNMNTNMNMSSSMDNNIPNMGGSSSFINDNKDRDFLRSNRLLVATTSGFADLDVIESVGLGLGAGGCVAVGSGRHVHIIHPSKSDNKPSDHTSRSIRNVGVEAISGIDSDRNVMGSSASGLFSDIEILMGSRCSKGYSIDAGRNLQVMSDELDGIECARERDQINGNAMTVDPHIPTTHQFNTSDKTSSSIAASTIDKSSSSNDLLNSLPSRDAMDPRPMDSTSQQEMPSMQAQVLSLTRLWAWVDRVESLGNEGLSVTSCGVINLLTSSSNATHSSVHAQLGVSVYSSESRDLAKELCGWTKMPSVSDAAVVLCTQITGIHQLSSYVILMLL